MSAARGRIEVYHVGPQWEANACGLWCERMCYFIEAAALSRRSRAEWLAHMGFKDWCDRSEFETALDAFLTFHM